MYAQGSEGVRVMHGVFSNGVVPSPRIHPDPSLARSYFQTMRVMAPLPMYRGIYLSVEQTEC